MKVSGIIRRTDHPDDPPDTIDQETNLTIDQIAAQLRRTYGPTAESDVQYGDKKYHITATVIRLMEE